MTLEDKLSLLRVNKTWKCQNKWEVLDEHKTTWQTNGLNNLNYTVIDRKIFLNDNCNRILVDLMTNDHWTDAVAGN